jgi:hypothetical protein
MSTAAEATATHVKVIAGAGNEEVHKFAQKKKSSGKYASKPKTGWQKQEGREKECRFCGKRHEFRKDKCPAYGQTCEKCKGKNHFANKCIATRKRINAVAAGWDPNDDEQMTEYEDEIMSLQRTRRL